MKTLIISFCVAVLTSIAAVTGVTAQEEAATFYQNDSYQGKKFYKDGGDYDPKKWQYKARSLKLRDGCYAVFYYNDKYGKKKDYKVSSSHKNLYDLFKKWNFKSNDYWRYIYRVKVVCGGGGEQAHNGNNNGGMRADDYYKKGYVVWYKGKGYRDSYEGLKMGEYDPQRFKYGASSLRIPRDVEVVFYYKDRNNRDQQYVATKDLQDFYRECQRWNLRDARDPYKYINRVVVRKRGGNNGHANNGNNNNGGMRADDYYKKGYVVWYKEKGYKDSYEGLKMGEYDPRRLKYGAYSLRVPRGREVVFYYMDRNNREQQYVVTQDLQDFYRVCEKWNIRDRREPYKFIKRIVVREAKGNNGHANNGNNNDYRNEKWYNDYTKGYVVYFEKPNFQGRYIAKPQGDWRYQQLPFIPQSLKPSSNRYFVIEYYDRNKRKKSATIKREVKDLNDFFRKEGGIHRDYEKYPYKALTRLAIMRQ